MYNFSHLYINNKMFKKGRRNVKKYQHRRKQEKKNLEHERQMEY